jgi:subtilisin family serine protease
VRRALTIGVLAATGLVCSTAHADPFSARQWDMTKIGAPQAWARTTGSPAVKVAVIDSGINLAHPDLAPNIWRNPGETGAGRERNGVDDDHNGYVDDWRGWDFVQQDNEPTDSYGHGTHIAGVIAARGGDGIGIAGVAGRTAIIPVRVLGNTNLGICAETGDALEYAVKAGARVVNVSIGQSTPCAAVRAAIERAPNTLFVISAGNEGEDVDVAPRYPCSDTAPNIVCVAATDRQDALPAYSNYGTASVDLAAPGSEIHSTSMRWGPEESVDDDGFEAPLGARWSTAGWQRSPFDMRSGSWALVGTANGWAALSVDLRGRRDCAVRVWIKRALDEQSKLWIENSTDGVHWERRPELLVGPGAYDEYLVDLAPLEGHATGRVRFRIAATTANPARFVALDDLEVVCVPPLLDGYTGAPDEYFTLTGTSHAAPHVAGVAALLLAQNPRMTAGQVKQRILATVDRLPALAGKTVSGGRLNAARAVGAAAAARPPVTPPPALAANLRRQLRIGALLRRGGFAVPGVSSAGRITVTLRGRGVLAAGARTVRGGTWSVRAKLTRRGRARLRRASRLRATLVVRLEPGSGAPLQQKTRVSLIRLRA